MTRENGFYWVSFKGGTPIVAYFNSVKWWFAGRESAVYDTELLVLSDRIPPPEVLKNTKVS